jgi:hypothetical protein
MFAKQQQPNSPKTLFRFSISESLLVPLALRRDVAQVRYKQAEGDSTGGRPAFDA